MIMPYLEFCNVLLIRCSDREKIKIQWVQNKGFKIPTCRDKYFPTSEVHKERGIASWETRAFTALNRLMFKFKFHENFAVRCPTMTRASMATLFQLDMSYSGNFVGSVSYVVRKSGTTFPQIYVVSKLKKPLLFSYKLIINSSISLSFLFIQYIFSETSGSTSTLILYFCWKLRYSLSLSLYGVHLCLY